MWHSAQPSLCLGKIPTSTQTYYLNLQWLHYLNLQFRYFLNWQKKTNQPRKLPKVTKWTPYLKSYQVPYYTLNEAHKAITEVISATRWNFFCKIWQDNVQLSKGKSFSKILENPAYWGSLKAVSLILPNPKESNTSHRTEWDLLKCLCSNP